MKKIITLSLLALTAHSVIANPVAPAVVDLTKFENTSGLPKKFKLIANGGAGSCSGLDTEYRYYRTDASGTRVKLVRHHGPVMCQYWILRSTRDSQGKKMTHRDIVNKFTYMIVRTDNFNEPVLQRPNNARVGQTWSTGSEVKTRNADGSNHSYWVFVQKNTLISTNETVTVPAGTYTGCIRIQSIRSSQSFGSFQRTSWRCPGVGEVKRVHANTGGSGYRVWKLLAHGTSTTEPMAGEPPLADAPDVKPEPDPKPEPTPDPDKG